jgi:hypothetical protein
VLHSLARLAMPDVAVSSLMKIVQPSTKGGFPGTLCE